MVGRTTLVIAHRLSALPVAKVISLEFCHRDVFLSCLNFEYHQRIPIAVITIKILIIAIVILQNAIPAPGQQVPSAMHIALFACAMERWWKVDLPRTVLILPGSCPAQSVCLNSFRDMASAQKFRDLFVFRHFGCQSSTFSHRNT